MVLVKSSIISALLFITLVNFGCEMGTQSTSKEVIEKDILEYMSAKYDKEFIVKSIRWEANVASKTMDKHFIKLAASDDPEELFDAKVSYENQDKAFDLLFEYYPRILMGKSANVASSKIITKFLTSFESKTVMINTYELDEDVYPNDSYTYEDIVAQAPDRWQTNLNISSEKGDFSNDNINELFFSLVEDHKRRNHDLLSIHLKSSDSDGKVSNHVLKLNQIQTTDLINEKDKIVAKIMRF